MTSLAAPPTQLPAKSNAPPHAQSGTPKPMSGQALGRPMPNILHVTNPAPESWPAALGRATTLGFDTLLLPALDIPTALIEAATGLGVSLLGDLPLEETPTAILEEAPGPFTRLAAPLFDPRQKSTAAPKARAAIATIEDAAALATWHAEQIKRAVAKGIQGVRLLGLTDLPGWAVPTILANLRTECPGVRLFAWTPGLATSVLEAIPPHTVDLVATSLARWDGQADWLWRELALLARIAPIVAEPGPSPDGQALAAILTEGWLPSDTPGLEALIAARVGSAAGTIAGLPWSHLVSQGGGPAYAILRTDTPDARQAKRATLAITTLAPNTIDVGAILTTLDTPAHHFTSPAGDPLTPAARLALEPGALRLYASTPLRTPAPIATLSRKRAEQAAATPRIAIENPTPSVENGRFPARLVLGSEARIEADIIADGHDHLAAVVRWRAPGTEDWSEAPMKHHVNDRWAAHIPLQALGVHHYAIEAWWDVYDTFVDELTKKYAAGIPITLELQEGAILVRKAAERSSKKLESALKDLVRKLEAGAPDECRTLLLSPETRTLMARADERRHRTTTDPIPLQVERPGAAFASWYEVFPRSMSDDPARHGTFRDVVRHLPRIQRMGFDVLYFPPIHPIGRINRKGPNNTLTPGPNDPGSPYAVGNEEGGHDAIHAELGTVEDFQHLRAAAAEHGIELALDFAIQCAPDHPWLKQHKGWFDWRPDGSIRYAENPPKKYQDIVNVDFYQVDSIPDLWLALANAVLFWCDQGIRLFRVDNPHTKPLPFWEWMIAEVQARYPDAVFLAEAFTRPKVMYRLAKVGFSQSYTYFTWRNTKYELQSYLNELNAELPNGAPRDFFRPHFFVNTPDINPVPLQGAPRQAFLVRTALATTLSGLWGLYNGFELCEATPVPGREEYLDSEKYQCRTWDWDRPGNITAEIAVLNGIRKRNPALHTHLGLILPQRRQRPGPPVREGHQGSRQRPPRRHQPRPPEPTILPHRDPLLALAARPPRTRPGRPRSDRSYLRSRRTLDRPQPLRDPRLGPTLRNLAPAPRGRE